MYHLLNQHRGSLTCHLFGGEEQRHITALGDLNTESFAKAIRCIIVVQPATKLPGIIADDVVFVRIIALLASEDVYANLLLGYPARSFAQRALADILKEGRQKRRLRKVPAGENAANQRLFGCYFVLRLNQHGALRCSCAEAYDGSPSSRCPQSAITVEENARSRISGLLLPSL